MTMMHPETTTKPTVAFVSTYPPTMCGLATFTASLRSAIAQNRGTSRGLDVVELTDSPGTHPDRPEVIASIVPTEPLTMHRAVDRLSNHDLVLVQHEYGIWGPQMGEAVLDFLEMIEAPLITTLHTLLPRPTPIQTEIIERLHARSRYIVVPTRGARELLGERYQVETASVVTVPHGTDRPHRNLAQLRSLDLARIVSPRLLSWGLIGPGKGLEWAIRAVATLTDRWPRISYTIAGKTHPKVLASEGEAYRRSLEDLVSDLGVEDNVVFIDDYLSLNRLKGLLLEATAALLPYDSSEQMVSGVLVEAISAGVPVIATSFPHAVEMARDGAVIAVPNRNSEAIADAVATLFETPAAMGTMAQAQRRVSAELDWANVGARYEDLIDSAARDSAKMSRASTAS
jgi:glycosyltransferase involved in cell wall biosynthesis